MFLAWLILIAVILGGAGPSPGGVEVRVSVDVKATRQLRDAGIW